MATESTGRIPAQLCVPSTVREIVLNIESKAVWDVHYHKCELRKHLQGTRSGFAKKLVPSEQAAETRVHDCTHEVAIQKGLLSALSGSIAGNLKTREDGHKMHVHVGVKQPYGKNR